MDSGVTSSGSRWFKNMSSPLVTSSETYSLDRTSRALLVQLTFEHQARLVVDPDLGDEFTCRGRRPAPSLAGPATRLGLEHGDVVRRHQRVEPERGALVIGQERRLVSLLDLDRGPLAGNMGHLQGLRQRGRSRSKASTLRVPVNANCRVARTTRFNALQRSLVVPAAINGSADCRLQLQRVVG